MHDVNIEIPPASGEGYKIFSDYLSPALLVFLMNRAEPVPGVKDMHRINTIATREENLSEENLSLETPAALQFVCDLYDQVYGDLEHLLRQRNLDREFIDAQTTQCVKENQTNHYRYDSPEYKTVIGQQNLNDCVVVGPLQEKYMFAQGSKISKLPEYVQGPHVTLFGPPDTKKLSINAMNAWHRQLPNEPSVVTELVEQSSVIPKWGADNED